jgi:hypothetical protein
VLTIHRRGVRGSGNRCASALVPRTLRIYPHVGKSNHFWTWRGDGVVDANDASSEGVPDSPVARQNAAPAEEIPDERYLAVRQYSLTQILGVWAAAAIPMALLAWVVAPLLRDQLSGDEPLAQALLISLTLGLVWQFALVLILMWRELGTLRWSRLRDALWLLPPRDPNTGRVGGKVWWWAVLFVVLGAIWALVPEIPGPSVRDFADFLDSDRGEAFFQGAWGWFAVIVVSPFSTPRSGRNCSFAEFYCHA